MIIYSRIGCIKMSTKVQRLLNVDPEISELPSSKLKKKHVDISETNEAFIPL